MLYNAYQTYEYAGTVWDPFTRHDIQSLEAVQRRSARFATNNFQKTSSVTSMLQKPNCPSLAEKRARCMAVMMYRIVNYLKTALITELDMTSSVS